MALTVLEESPLFIRVRDEHENEYWTPKEKFFKILTPKKNSHLTRENKMDSVKKVMSDGQFRTLLEISKLTGYTSLTGLSACIRALRKTENGAHAVDKRKREDSNDYEYRLST